MTNCKPLASMQLQVRYHECDPSGIAFNANYLTWADIASFDCLQAVLGSYSDLTEQGLDLVVADSNLRFLAPTTHGDDLVITGYLHHLGTTSMVFRFEMYKDDTAVAEVTNRYVWVNGEAVQPTAPPESVRQKLLAYAP